MTVGTRFAGSSIEAVQYCLRPGSLPYVVLGGPLLVRPTRFHFYSCQHAAALLHIALLLLLLSTDPSTQNVVENGDLKIVA